MRMSSIVGAVVLAVVATSVTPTQAAKPTRPAQSPLKITGLNVTNLQATGPNSLLATLDLTGTLRGKPFTLTGLKLPINLSRRPNANDPECPILHLELEIEKLNILGLVVELNDCDEGPVTVDITADSTTVIGGLLCDLLGGQGLNLSLILDVPGLDLTGLLNDILGQLVGGLTPAVPGNNDASAAACPLVTLELDAIDLNLDVDLLNLLGLSVETSDICLFVYAEPNGGLLGNLLCQVSDLLNGNANLRAVDALVNNILRIIGRLGL